jgi:hypothetical protein
MNKAIVKLKTFDNGFIHTVLSLTMALFILFEFDNVFCSYWFEFDNGFIHTVFVKLKKYE